MNAITEAEQLIKKHLTAIAEESMDSNKMMFYSAKQCALITIDEKIKYHESLFDKGFNQVHIALSSPIKTYLDIMNPMLNHLREVKKEVEKTPA